MRMTQPLVKATSRSSDDLTAASEKSLVQMTQPLLLATSRSCKDTTSVASDKALIVAHANGTTIVTSDQSLMQRHNNCC